MEKIIVIFLFEITLIGIEVLILKRFLADSVAEGKVEFHRDRMIGSNNPIGLMLQLELSRIRYFMNIHSCRVGVDPLVVTYRMVGN